VPSRAPLLLLVGLALLSVLAVVRSMPPRAKPETAPVTEFSAGRAEKVLADLVGDGAPHPPGTAVHDRVREAVASRLSELGLTVERMTSFECGMRTCASVTNLLARLPGKVGANAVLLVAHYDSVPAGPGASDDGMGVATLLETARALAASPPSRRPVWLLVTDGEELGLLGAKAFVKNKVLVDQVGVVVNVDNRGTTGPSLMFETSKNNAGLVGAFAAGTEHPVASSIFPTVYSFLPNGTDLNVFKRAGLAGLNYAVIGGVSRYHTPRDDLAHADPRSLEHHGDNALAVVRALADGRDSVAATSDAVFFDVLGRFVVRWPDAAGPFWVLGLLAAYALSTVLAMRKGLMTAREHAIGLLGIFTVPLAGAVAWASGFGFRLLGATGAAAGSGFLALVWIAQPAPYIVVSCGLGGLAAAAIVLGLAKHAGVVGLGWGSMTWFIAFGAVLSVALPGFSFLFLVPATLGCVGALGWTLRDRPSDRLAWLWTALVPISAVLSWVAPLGLLYDALGLSLVPALAAGSGSLVWTAGPAIAELAPRVRSLLFSGVATASLVAAGLTLAVASHTEDSPAHASLRTYVTDGGDARTTLSTREKIPNGLATLFPLVESPWPWSSEQSLAVKAGPRALLPAPDFELLANAGEGARRRVTVRLRSSRGAEVVGLAVAMSSHPDAIRVEGAPLEPNPWADAPWTFFECVTTPEGGVEVELTVDARAPAEAFVYDRTPGVPDGDARKLLDARPPNIVPIQNGDVTVVARHVEL
jgi:hypothetical protein